MAKYSFKGLETYYTKTTRGSVTGAWFKRRIEFYMDYMPSREWAIHMAKRFSISRGSSNYQPGLKRSLDKVDAEVKDIMKINHVGRKVALHVYWDEIRRRYELNKAGVPLENAMSFMHAWIGDAVYPEDE